LRAELPIDQALRYVLDSFSFTDHRARMSEPPPLRPATPDEIATTLAFALQFEGRKRVHQADDAMARIAAERLVRHLERSGFVVMKGPPASGHSSAAYLPNRTD
jgi:hypothetical protein